MRKKRRSINSRWWRREKGCLIPLLYPLDVPDRLSSGVRAGRRAVLSDLVVWWASLTYIQVQPSFLLPSLLFCRAAQQNVGPHLLQTQQRQADSCCWSRYMEIWTR